MTQQSGESGKRPTPSIVAGKPVKDGVLLVCECGTETHLVTVRRDATGALIPTWREAAFTCEGCGTSHWFTIEPGAGGTDAAQ